MLWPSMSAITLAQRRTSMRLSPEAFLSRGQTRRCRRGSTLSILPLGVPRLGVGVGAALETRRGEGARLPLRDRRTDTPTSAQIAANSTNTGALPWTVACTDQDCRLPAPKRQRRVEAWCGQGGALRPGGPPRTLPLPCHPSNSNGGSPPHRVKCFPR